MRYERIWLPIVSVVVVFGAAELLARALGLVDALDADFRFLIRSVDGDVDESFNEEDPYLMWRPRAGYSDERYTINGSGMRDREYPVERSDVTRIAALGDSSTFGHGVALEQTWHEVLEAAMGFEVLNFGVTGYTSAQGLEQYRRVVGPYRPDIVIAYFGINDLQARFHLSDAEVMAAGGSAMLERITTGLSRLHVWRLIRAGVDRAARAMEADEPPVARVSAAALRDNLLALDEAVRGDGGRLVLIVPPACPRRTRGWPQKPALDAYRRVIELVAHERGLTVIPHTAVDDDTLFLDTVHPTPDGHRRLAEAVKAAL